MRQDRWSAQDPVTGEYFRISRTEVAKIMRRYRRHPRNTDHNIRRVWIAERVLLIWVGHIVRSLGIMPGGTADYDLNLRKTHHPAPTRKLNIPHVRGRSSLRKRPINMRYGS